jgi:hypothetical protein
LDIQIYTRGGEKVVVKKDVDCAERKVLDWKSRTRRLGGREKMERAEEQSLGLAVFGDGRQSLCGDPVLSLLRKLLNDTYAYGILLARGVSRVRQKVMSIVLAM